MKTPSSTCREKQKLWFKYFSITRITLKNCHSKKTVKTRSSNAGATNNCGVHLQWPGHASFNYFAIENLDEMAFSGWKKSGFFSIYLPSPNENSISSNQWLVIFMGQLQKCQFTGIYMEYNERYLENSRSTVVYVVSTIITLEVKQIEKLQCVKYFQAMGMDCCKFWRRFFRSHFFGPGRPRSYDSVFFYLAQCYFWCRASCALRWYHLRCNIYINFSLFLFNRRQIE